MVSGSIEKVQVMLQVFTKGFGRNIGVAQTQLKKVGRNMHDFGQVMQMPLDNLKTLNKRFKVMKSSGGKFAFSLREVTHGMRGFRMEMLGIMFFGMALTRIFSSLTRTSMEWMGTTEILSAALGLLFLPTAEKVTDWVLKFLDWVDNLTEKQKKWIGNILLVVGVFGLMFTIVGTLALGIGSLMLVFGKSFGFIIAKIGAAMIIFIGLGLIVSGITNIINGKLEGIGLVIMGIGIILLLFIGWWALIPIAVGAAVYFVIKHWTKVKSWFSNFWTWIKNLFKKIWDLGKKVFEFSPLGIAINLGKKVLGSFQTGGVVPQTGPYMLHQGETVVPTGQQGFNASPTININASIASDYDVRRLAEELKRYWVSDFERASQGRTA